MNWLERQLQLASERVASWPEWKQKLMREINRLREERKMSEGKKFTCLFNGQPSDFEGNPFHSDTPFGRATAISCSDLFDETEKMEDNIARIKAANAELVDVMRDVISAIINDGVYHQGETPEDESVVVFSSGVIECLWDDIKSALANAEKE